MQIEYNKHLKNALKWFHNPEKLGTESPLAAPYFLSHVIDQIEGVASPAIRGELLQIAIQRAALTLWDGPFPQHYDEMKAALLDIRQRPGTPHYAYLVLELRCFQQFLKPRRTALIWESDDYLPGSRAEHYRDFDSAVEQLGAILLNHLHPTLHPELPIAPTHFVGYEAQIAQIEETLRNQKAIHLNGPGGIGKTTLGATLMARIEDRPTFWYTFRPAFNDHMNSILFALGHFLHQQGTSRLWQLLATTGGVIQDAHFALTTILEDFQQLQDRPPILFFDEVDRIHHPDPDQAKDEHRQILEFIEGLSSQVPILLIGQRPVLYAEVHITLPGLAVPQIYQLCQTIAPSFTEMDAKRLYEYTKGNPRLILLCMAMRTENDSIEETLAKIPQSASLSSLLNRLWYQLQPNERRLLQRIAVFQGPAPLDSWAEEADILQMLIQRRLVIQNGQGGVELLSVIGDRIYDSLSADLRGQLHIEAAIIRLERAEYTSAAYHFVQAGKPNKAIQIWYPHRKQEIERGMADIALRIFKEVPYHHLSQRERKVLELLRTELYQLCGDLKVGLASLETQDWSESSEVDAHGLLLKGKLLSALGEPEKALNAYEDGLKMITRLLQRACDFYYQRGLLHLQRQELTQAWHETQLAEYRISALQGMIKEAEGAFSQAYTFYQHALTLADTLQDKNNLAHAESNLAGWFGGQKNLEKAVEHANRAIKIYEQLGDRPNQARVQSDLSFIYVQTRKFQQAIDVATQAFSFFKAAGEVYHATILLANLAEAHVELDNLEEAERFAHEVLVMEERSPYPYALFTLGQVNRKRKNWATAEQYFAESIKVAQANSNLSLEAYAWQALGHIYQDGGKYREAREVLERALQLFKRLEIVDEIQEIEAYLETEIV